MYFTIFYSPKVPIEPSKVHLTTVLIGMLYFALPASFCLNWLFSSNSNQTKLLQSSCAFSSDQLSNNKHFG